MGLKTFHVNITIVVTVTLDTMLSCGVAYVYCDNPVSSLVCPYDYKRNYVQLYGRTYKPPTYGRYTYQPYTKSVPTYPYSSAFNTALNNRKFTSYSARHLGNSYSTIPASYFFGSTPYQETRPPHPYVLSSRTYGGGIPNSIYNYYGNYNGLYQNNLMSRAYLPRIIPRSVGNLFIRQPYNLYFPLKNLSDGENTNPNNRRFSSPESASHSLDVNLQQSGQYNTNKFSDQSLSDISVIPLPRPDNNAIFSPVSNNKVLIPFASSDDGERSDTSAIDSAISDNYVMLSSISDISGAPLTRSEVIRSAISDNSDIHSERSDNNDVPFASSVDDSIHSERSDTSVINSAISDNSDIHSESSDNNDVPFASSDDTVTYIL